MARVRHFAAMGYVSLPGSDTLPATTTVSAIDQVKNVLALRSHVLPGWLKDAGPEFWSYVLRPPSAAAEHFGRFTKKKADLLQKYPDGLDMDWDLSSTDSERVWWIYALMSKHRDRINALVRAEFKGKPVADVTVGRLSVPFLKAMYKWFATALGMSYTQALESMTELASREQHKAKAKADKERSAHPTPLGVFVSCVC
jgi:hypothetical protein